jgi:RNA polymerase sigma factor (sigma-70 family)
MDVSRANATDARLRRRRKIGRVVDPKNTMRTVGVIDWLGAVGASSHPNDATLAAAATAQIAVRTPRAPLMEIGSGIIGLMDMETPPAPIATLLENHRVFLRYLERRVRDRELAEDILQDAFAKVVARPEQAPDDEAIVPWFYRTLRNAAIDQFRRRGAAGGALEAFARELETQETPSAEMESEICECVSRLASTLKPEYAEALEAIEVSGTPVKTFAERRGLSSSNAAVRVFRAREALKKRVTESCGTCAEHGCVNCTCGKHT